MHNASFARGVFARLGYQLVNVFDTLSASRELRGREAHGGHSLRAVCERELGITLDKRAQTSTWARRPLSAEQLSYAAADVEVLLPVYEVFRTLVTVAPLMDGDS